ncbi:capsule assembly Wzi family protein [Gillisia limnaea]|uniref:Capsule assembly protein Wzi n=1 Tax=Gillisia limnaea (strain DSM 15749 / LMG 21470 / R-8282) TaxID=865937 RepID=H2BZZ0_GILLR|nr:capsule assembly Wzi family protein [Gillisia limnaea]EHQ02357.1 hypothetical protein Gilli_1713 [Gillisia limnaea DSM 15749]
MFQKTFIFLFLFLSFNSYSQLEFSGEVNLQGMYSTGEDMPFWMYKNSRGRISKNTNAGGWITGRAIYELGATSTLEAGLGILYQDGIADEVFLDESYLQFRNNWLEVIAGRKQQEELYNGLSSTNENILWSLNARPIPGLQIRTSKPVFLSERSVLGFEGSWNEYFLEADRHVSAAKLHHKRLVLVLQPNERWTFKAGGQHFVQWGGTSQTRGDQPEKFEDYIKNITGQTAISGGSGRHIGGFEAHVKRSFRDFSLEFFYNYLFESAPGIFLKNIPDGRYGIYFENEDRDRVVNSFIYEFTYTRNQGSYFGGGAEDYFNNRIYSSGWTYENRVLGSPFFTVSPGGEGIVNNSFIAHHIGIGGQFSDYFNVFPYRLLLSYRSNEGTLLKPYISIEQAFYLYSDFGVLRNFIDLDIQAGLELTSDASPIFGIGVKLSKRF